MIYFRDQYEGSHCYPAAATLPHLVNERELANVHRHMFHVKVGIEVFHGDRDIEFINLKRWVRSLFSHGTIDFNNQSCEMIADELADKVSGKYPNRDMIIEVSEDGENGAISWYNKESQKDS